MKGIETVDALGDVDARLESDHCPAMKGIETVDALGDVDARLESDHCPAMKGIETSIWFSSRWRRSG